MSFISPSLYESNKNQTRTMWGAPPHNTGVDNNYYGGNKNAEEIDLNHAGAIHDTGAAPHNQRERGGDKLVDGQMGSQRHGQPYILAGRRQYNRNPVFR